VLHSEPVLGTWQTVQLHRALNKYVIGVWSDNITAAFFVAFSVAIFVPDIDGIQNKLICLWTGTTCSVDIASTCSANLYDISRREPSRRALNLKQPRAPKMKICLCVQQTSSEAHSISDLLDSKPLNFVPISCQCTVANCGANTHRLVWSAYALHTVMPTESCITYPEM